MREPLIMNSGNTIAIPYIEYSDYRVNNNNVWGQALFHYHRGERVGSVIDLSGYAWQADAKGAMGSQNDIRLIMLDLRTPHNRDYYESGTGKTYLDLIKEKVIWLWGSMSEGGVGIAKTTNGRYVFISLDGLYYNSTNQFYSYYYTASTAGALTDGLSQGELTSVMFYNDEYINDGYTLSVMWQPTGLFWKKYDFTYLDVQLTNIFVYTSSITNLTDASNNAEYVSGMPVFDDYFPQVGWVCSDSEGVQYPNSGYSALGRNDNYVGPGYAKVGMSVYGGASVGSSDPYGNAGNTTTGGGGGGWGNNCDPSHTPDDSQFETDGINSGFFTIYNPDKQDLQDFNDFLFTDITDSMATQLKRLISNPLDYVLYIAMVHFKPQTSTTEAIKYCGIDSGVAAPVVTKQMQKIDCGSITIEDSTSSFLSYEPYCKATVFLPYIGIKDINIDDIMSGTVHLTYWIDLLTGSCVASLEVTRTSRSFSDSYVPGVVIGEYTGNVFQNMPITATDWRGLFGSVLQFAGGAASLAAGNAAGLGAMASAVIGEKQHVSRSGQLGANYGYIGRQRPCIIIERPVLNMPHDFGKWEGYTSSMLVELGTLSGYTEIDESTLWVYDEFDGITEREAEMLRNICNSGFYI